MSQIEPATTIHPIFFSKKDFHRGSRGGRECASIMSDSEFLNLLVFASLVPKMLSEGDRQMVGKMAYFLVHEIFGGGCLAG